MYVNKKYYLTWYLLQDSRIYQYNFNIFDSNYYPDNP